MRWLCFVSVIAFGTLNGSGAEFFDRSLPPYSREVTFEVTFANHDLIWLGDPASPTSVVYPKPQARPIATDFHVRTLITDCESPKRRYFHEARITAENGGLSVFAFTRQREKRIGSISEDNRFSANDFYKDNTELLPSWPTDGTTLIYDDQKNALYHDVDVPGPLLRESLDFLPLNLVDGNERLVEGQFSIDLAQTHEDADASVFAVVSLNLRQEQKQITLATATLPTVFQRADIKIGSFDNATGTYVAESAYRAGGATTESNEISVTVSLPGKFSSSIQSDAASLVLVNTPAPTGKIPQLVRQNIVIDGKFDDWRNVEGVDDPRGDVVPYLEYVPDVDLLELKVSNDDQNIYLYARVVGKIGHSHPNGGRSYFYAYMDVDRNSETGFLPSRDDDCYYGVDIGDDCEVQFEFVNNTLRKTFYGFCGIGGNDNVLKQQLSIGKSQYGRFDANGVERANYKSEYIFRGGIAEITEDLKFGSSDTIHIAVSPDGSEVEVSSTFTGFLKNPNGQPIVQLGQSIDIAVGVECDSKAYPGKRAWGADSTPIIRGYRLLPLDTTSLNSSPEKEQLPERENPDNRGDENLRGVRE